MTKLIVALDQEVWQSKKLVRDQLETHDWFKIETETFLQRDGYQFVQELLYEGKKIMLDLKRWATPFTISRLMDILNNELFVDMVTIHGSCIKTAHRLKTRDSLKLLTIYDLTSDIESPMYYQPVPIFDSVVFSVKNAQKLRFLYKGLIFVCPGIRLEDEDKGNHTETFTPAQARAADVDFIVMGSSIYTSSNPRQIVNQIKEELEA